MKIAVNTITIKPVPFAEKLRLISEAGFTGVGLWMEEIETYQAGGKGKPVKELLEEHGLTPVEMQLIRKWQYLAGDERRQALEDARDFFGRMKKLGIDCPAVVLPSEEAGDLKKAVEDFREICHLAEEFGLRVQFEFLGWARQIHDVKTAWEIVKEADCPNGGMLIDTFHFAKAGSAVEDLKRVEVDKVFLVHVNDVKLLPLGIKEQSRGFRFFPGEGEAPLREIMGVFVDKGYTGFYCLEIFNETYWAQDPAAILKRGLASMKALFDPE